MIIIGECINSTSKRISEAVAGKEEEFLLKLAQDQSDAGADYIGVNVGTGKGSLENEVTDMRWLVSLIQERIDTPICIDSSDPSVIQAGLEVRQERPTMINSVKAEKESIQAILPLAKEKSTTLIGLAMDENGIPSSDDGRIRACEFLVNAAEEYGILHENLYIDSIVMPISTGDSQGRTTLETLKRIKESFPGVKTVLGLSNISFGLPGRSVINQSLLAPALYLGLDAAIMDPLDMGLVKAMRATEAVLGRDRRCRKYTRLLRRSG